MEGERKRERETLLSYCQASVCLRHTESSQGGVYNQLAAINSPQHVPCQHTLGGKKTKQKYCRKLLKCRLSTQLLTITTHTQALN